MHRLRVLPGCVVPAVHPPVVVGARRVVVPVARLQCAPKVEAHTWIAVDAEHELEGVGAGRRPPVAFALPPAWCEAVVADPRRPRAEDALPSVRGVPVGTK